MKTGIVFAGVGGQGVLTASSILGVASLKAGLNVVMSEVHGMAQRGGVVVTEMNIGDAHSPLVGRGEADIIVGFEPVEAYRVLSKAHPGTHVVVNVEPIVPISASLGNAQYPEVQMLLDRMNNLKVYPLEATQIARDLGNVITANIVMLGALSAIPGFPVPADSIKAAIMDKFPKSVHEINLKAFDKGAEQVRKLA
ncbi:MAG: indolepyruvate oxidoreductase subunit beta [Euryarchaeota archaeon]|nr:indolepyruvate oxidoreductase subunit beta [Euryarchaeota archaeon]